MTLEFNNINSLSEFNKIFQNDINQINSDINENGAFEEIFNKVSNEQNNTNIQNQLNAGITMNVGADTINAQKVDNISDSSRMMNTFGSSLKDSIESLNKTQKSAETAVETLASGGDISIHEVMIAQEKSSIAMQMAIQLRNQALNIYNELKNINI